MDKCKYCKYNYKPFDCEPRCNIMCENYSAYEHTTNYEVIMKSNVDQLAKVLLACFKDGYTYSKRFSKNKFNKAEYYKEMVEWLKSKIE